MAKIWTKEEEAARLAERFKHVPNKAAWAREHKLPGGPSMLNQHIQGHRPMNMDAALVYMAGFGVRLDEISPRLAQEMGQALKRLDEANHSLTAAVNDIAATYRLSEPADGKQPTAAANLALTLAQAFEELPVRTADGRTREQLHVWLLAQIDAWPNVDVRKRARAESPTPAPSPGRQTRPAKARAPRAEGSAS
jgi:hypothetical protein